MRARNIKPGFFENEELAELSFECRLLYIGLWCYADREGRFEWRPKRIKALIFPYDNLDINKLLNVITCKGHVMTYSYNEKTYGFIPTFSKHNRPHPHEAKSQCPEPKDVKNQIPELNVMTCHTNVMQCQADIRNDDIRNDDKDILSGKPDDIPYKEIIDCLNDQTDSKYRYTSETTKKLIRTRWNEGFREEDFKYVIDIKTHDWANDEEFKKYLRPQTLFSHKFEGYLNEKRKLSQEEKDEKLSKECIEEYYKKHPEERE